VQAEDEERCTGQGEKQRNGVNEEPGVGQDQAPVLEQQECRHERNQRHSEVVREDDERPRDLGQGPAHGTPQIDPVLFGSSQ
jgi:hypothetical protein